jgi:protocatechuate 3,4-dioxygenase alpha subunit
MRRHPVTAWQTLGPFFDRQLLHHGHDLTDSGPERPQGEVIEIAGRVLQEGGVPVQGALIEIWQANAAGRYAHPADRSERPLDPNFGGFGRTLSDPDGRYRFITIKPGAVPFAGNRWQAPHVLFAIFAAGLLRRLVTRLYFPDEPATDSDPILATIDDAQGRASLIARQDVTSPRRYIFDIVLRGEGETAFFVD